MISIPRFWRNQKSRYNLTGSKCTNCGETYFPVRPTCPRCRRASKLEEVHLSGTGVIETFTVIHTPAPGFEFQTPYIMAVVKLDGGPMLTTQIVDVEPEDVKIGMRVEKVFRKIQEDGEGGLIYYGFKFRPRRS